MYCDEKHPSNRISGKRRFGSRSLCVSLLFCFKAFAWQIIWFVIRHIFHFGREREHKRIRHICFFNAYFRTQTVQRKTSWDTSTSIAYSWVFFPPYRPHHPWSIEIFSEKSLFSIFSAKYGVIKWFEMKNVQQPD